MLEKSHKDKDNKRKINAKPLRFKHLIIKTKERTQREKLSVFQIGIGIAT